MTKNEIGKYCYDLLSLKDKIEKPSVLTAHLDPATIEEYANKYAHNVLGVSSESFSRLLNKNAKTMSGYIKANNFGDNYMNEKRKSDAVKLLTDFVNQELSIKQICIKEDITLSDFEEYANVVRYNDLDLYNKYKNKIAVHKEVNYTQEEIEKQKYCYTLLKNNNWSTNQIGANHDLSLSEIRKNALLYVTDTLGMTKDEFYYDKYFNGYEIKKDIYGKEIKEKNVSVDKKHYVLYEELSDAQTNDEIINIIKKYYKAYNRRKIHSLRQKVNDYTDNHRKTESSSISGALKEKIDIYISRNQEYLDNVLTIISGLKNIPDFDIFDYMHITTININELLDEVYEQLVIGNKRIINDKYDVINFSTKSDENVDEYLDSEFYITNSDGVIYDPKYEGKKEVLDYYISHNFPINKQTFESGLKRYMEGTLYEYNNKIRTR